MVIGLHLMKVAAFVIASDILGAYRILLERKREIRYPSCLLSRAYDCLPRRVNRISLYIDLYLADSIRGALTDEQYLRNPV